MQGGGSVRRSQWSSATVSQTIVCEATVPDAYRPDLSDDLASTVRTGTDLEHRGVADQGLVEPATARGS